MPVKVRVAKERRPSFSPDAIRLFIELEAVPLRRRKGQEYRDKVHQLARLLNLVDEFWTCNDVNDTSREPCHPPGYAAFDAWHCCRAVRNLLLETVRNAPKPTPGASPAQETFQ